ncbi:MAG: SLOG family protein [Gemmatimonadaceae bacterium]|nr:SLOG family protein [Gemmatimonadaceae bacterium]
MRVIVCGGREYNELQHVWTTLSGMSPEITAIAHGGADGADCCAGAWASAAGVSTRVFRANWSLHGRAAGPLRNAQMLREFQPDAVIAFPGGRGTADMIRQARAAGVRVIEIPQHTADAAGEEG